MFAVRRFEPSEQDSVRRTNARSKRSSVSTATDGDDALLASAVEAAPPRKSAGTAQSSESQAETIEDEERRRLKEAKHEKRRARSRPQSSAADEQEPATGAGSEQQQGVDASSSKSGGDPLSVVDLKALLSLKNSTRRKELKPAAAAVSEEVNVPAVHTWRVMGQRKKDPDTRAAERAARRRARREDGSERGEHAEDDAQFASSSPAAAAVTDDRKERAEHSRKRAKTEQHPSSASLPSSALLPPSLDPQTAPTADEGAEREQKKPVERPDWMLRGVHIDPNASCPTAAFALHPALLSTLQSAGITSFFPVQATVIPLVLRTRGAHDLCVSSPTGSGKTLIYILPLLHALSQRKIVRLRAVVLVPSRGLAQQVGREMEAYARGVGVKVAVSVGGGSFKREQEALVRRRETRDSELIDYREAFHRSRGLDEGAEDEYESAVDVLVTTPGRLVDHLDGTPGFTLRHLHFFVVDEVDRLLTQHYHDWTQRVWLAMQPSPAPASSDSPAGSTALELRPSAPVQCQKLLLSATLTSHPAKLASLHLHNPVLFTDSQSRQKRYTIPAGLSASFILSDASEKPLLLLHLLSSLHLVRSASSSSSSKAAHPSRDAGEQVLVFTSSVDGCHRVARLLALWGGLPLSGVQLAAEPEAEGRAAGGVPSARRRRPRVQRCDEQRDGHQRRHHRHQLRHPSVRADVRAPRGQDSARRRAGCCHHPRPTRASTAGSWPWRAARPTASWSAGRSSGLRWRRWSRAIARSYGISATLLGGNASVRLAGRTSSSRSRMTTWTSAGRRRRTRRTALMGWRRRRRVLMRPSGPSRDSNKAGRARDRRAPLTAQANAVDINNNHAAALSYRSLMMLLEGAARYRLGNNFSRPRAQNRIFDPNAYQRRCRLCGERQGIISGPRLVFPPRSLLYTTSTTHRQGGGIGVKRECETSSA